MLADHVEATFGRHLLAALRHQAHRMRLGGERDAHHVVGRGHLEIERLGDLGLQPRHVLVADVPAIFAQMRGDAVGPGLDRKQRRAQRIGMAAAARVTQGRDMVDIDAEAERRSGHFRTHEIGETDEYGRRLSINTFDAGNDRFGAQLGQDRAQMLQIVDFEIDRRLREVR